MKPIFVVGSGRSGTSILTASLVNGAHIPGYLEGHFLPIVHKLCVEVDKYYHAKRGLLSNQNHMIAHVDKEAVKAQVKSMVRTMAEGLATGSRWVDKSPDATMLHACPTILDMWPEAKFVFAKRRGIENVVSRLKKFPHVDFENHCRLWAECMSAWFSVRAQLGDSAIEMEQRRIALESDVSAARLGRFLELSEPQREAVRVYFSERRPQKTGVAESELACSIRDVGWSDDQMGIFRKHCSDMMQKFQYSEESSYYLDA